MEKAADMYGARVDFTDRQFVTILHTLGAFMFILGVLAAVAALKPIRYRAVGYSFAALFVIRAVQRVVFREQMEEVLHIAPGRNLFNICFFLALGVSLAALQWYAERVEGVGTARGTGAV
jgi:hypothetical protein